MVTMLPTTLNKFFWDTRFESIDKEKNKDYIISRLLELGDEDAVAWLEKTYEISELTRVARGSRILSPKSRAYWNLKY